MLEYSREFMVLASRLNYTVAAAELNVSQPTLSRHMADLEKELGFRLLERNPVALTPAGRYYLEAVSDVVERLDAAIERGRAVSREGGRAVSISMVPSECPYSDIVYAAVARLREERVDIAPRFLVDKTLTVFEAVASGSADVGVLLDRPEQLPEGFACEWLVDTPFDAWLHEDSPVLNHLPVRFEDLADCRLVCSTNRQFRTWLDGMRTAFRTHGMEPKLHLKDLDDMTSFLLEAEARRASARVGHRRARGIQRPPDEDPLRRSDPVLFRVPPVPIRPRASLGGALREDLPRGGRRPGRVRARLRPAPGRRRPCVRAVPGASLLAPCLHFARRASACAHAAPPRRDRAPFAFPARLARMR